MNHITLGQTTPQDPVLPVVHFVPYVLPGVHYVFTKKLSAAHFDPLKILLVGHLISVGYLVYHSLQLFV